MIDTDAAVKTLLALSSAITTQVGTRIHCPSLPAAHDPANKAISYYCRGGNVEQELPILKVSIGFECWGLKLADARAVFGALHTFLVDQGSQEIATGVRFLWAKQEVYGQDRTDPDTGWQHILSFYELAFRQ